MDYTDKSYLTCAGLSLIGSVALWFHVAPEEQKQRAEITNKTSKSYKSR